MPKCLKFKFIFKMSRFEGEKVSATRRFVYRSSKYTYYIDFIYTMINDKLLQQISKIDGHEPLQFSDISKVKLQKKNSNLIKREK